MKEKAQICRSHLSYTSTNLQDTLESGVRRGAGKEEKWKVEDKSFCRKKVILIYNLTFFVMICNLIFYLHKDRIN